MPSESTNDDYEVRRTIWDSRVPVEFVLDNSDLMLQTQQSSFMMVQRVSYFPTSMVKPLNFLLGNLDEKYDARDVWLQSDGVTLKWNYPVGVLYDLYNVETSLPWLVTMRLKNFPDELIRGTKTAIKMCFIQSMKEADQLKHKGNVIYAMKAEEHTKLFDSLCNGIIFYTFADRFDDFWSVNKKLMVNASSNEGSESQLLHIPIRFYDRLSSTFRQVLVSPNTKTIEGETSESSRDSSLGDAIKAAFGTDFNLDRYEAISHGVKLPALTPVLWLARNLSYPDNFVHVVLRPRKENLSDGEERAEEF